MDYFDTVAGHDFCDATQEYLKRIADELKRQNDLKMAELLMKRADEDTFRRFMQRARALRMEMDNCD